MISVTDLLDGEVLCEQTVASVVGSSLVSSRKCCSVRAPSHNCLSDPNLPFYLLVCFFFFQLLFMFCCSTCISAGMGFSSFFRWSQFFGPPNFCAWGESSCSNWVCSQSLLEFPCRSTFERIRLVLLRSVANLCPKFSIVPLLNESDRSTSFCSQSLVEFRALLYFSRSI